MHHTLIFFMLEEGIRFVPQAQYARLLRGEDHFAELADRTIRVADWYVNVLTAGLPRIVNETYSLLQLDKDGGIDWRRCRIGSARNHALFDALRRSRYDDPDDDPEVRQLRAVLCDEVTWMPDSEEKARLEAAAAHAMNTFPTVNSSRTWS